MTYTHYTQNDKNIFLIHMRDERQYPFSALVEKGLHKYIQQKKNIAIIANKKGYASGLLCKDCGHIPRCERCDIAVAVHKDEQGGRFGICHICKQHYTYTASCANCGGHAVADYGVGTQQVAEMLQDKHNVDALRIESEQVNSPRKVTQLTQQIQDYHVFVGTSLLALPPAQVTMDMVIVLYADRGLHIPDFQSQRQTFTQLYGLMTHARDATILIQSYNPEHPAIHLACAGEYEKMLHTEHRWRKQNNYPPYTQLCVILYKHEIEQRLHTTTNKLYQELLYLKEQYDLTDLEIYTTPPLIYKIYGKYRYNIVLKGSQIRQFMDIAYSKLNMRSRGFKIDREPMQLL